MKYRVVFILIFSNFLLYGQVGGERIYNFLNIPVSARQAALGGDIVSLSDDVNQPHWNPATISRFMDNQVSVNYINYLDDINMGSVSFAHLINRRFGTIHSGIQYIDYGDFIGADEDGNETGDFSSRDLAISIGYGYRIPWSNFYLGANARLISSKIENYTSNGGSIDFGIYYFSDFKPYSFTVVLRNLGYQLSPYDQKREYLPFTITFGATYKLIDVPLKWYLSLDNLQQWNLAEPNPSNSQTDLDGNLTEEDINFFDNAIRHVIIGAEFFPDRNFNIRFGYNFRRAAELNLTESRTFAGISAGFGLKMGRMKFEYAFTKYHSASNSSTFSLLFDLNRNGF